jgi:hypothetical protein
MARRWPWRAAGLATATLATALATGTGRASGSLLPVLVGAPSEPLAPWALATLPAQKPPVTRFAAVDVDGVRALRIDAEASYGNLVFTLAPPPAAPVVAGTLSWRWRVETPNGAADLRHRRTDDTTAKVCLLFDLALDRVPFDERWLIRLARSRTGEPLPAATICYVWDAREGADTALDNPYSRRVRYLVLRGAESPPGAWREERRDIAADFRRLFGDESREVPRLLAVGVGADADNTGGRSRAYLTGLTLAP